MHLATLTLIAHGFYCGQAPKSVKAVCVYSNNGEMLFTKNPKTKAGEVALWLNTCCPSRGLRVLFPALTLYSGFQGL